MIELLMLVKNEQAMLPQTLPLLSELVDCWTIIDTGSTDGTPEAAAELLSGVPGEMHQREWRSFADNRNDLFDLCHGDEWLLLWDADWEPVIHPKLKEWLAGNPCPSTSAWMIEVRDRGLAWWLPQLLRYGHPWRFAGQAHACLQNLVRHQKLRGLAANHLRAGAGGNSTERLEANLEALRDGYYADDPRATFYTAETLKNLGRTFEAVDAYQKRARMDGWEEEAWYAEYQAAKLEKDVPGLLAAHHRRPWRHEPLTAAARILARQPNPDVLFHEAAP